MIHGISGILKRSSDSFQFQWLWLSGPILPKSILDPQGTSLGLRIRISGELTYFTRLDSLLILCFSAEDKNIVKVASESMSCSVVSDSATP